MQTLFQNRTTGVVSELVQVCQLMLKSQINCILREIQHQFNSPKNCISVTYCTELDLVYLQTNYFAKGHRFPP